MRHALRAWLPPRVLGQTMTTEGFSPSTHRESIVQGCLQRGGWNNNAGVEGCQPLPRQCSSRAAELREIDSAALKSNCTAAG